MAVNDKVHHNTVSAPDIDSVVSDAWDRRSFPIQGQGSRNVVQVVVKRSVLDAICKHGLSRTDVEVCGVLVGNCYRDERGPFIYIEAMIQGEHSDNKVAQVTFTSETWNHIQDEMDQHFSGQRILGWYHTHPGFGIFLSAMDMFIHENFFNEGSQLALVYDPVKGEDGLFVWRDGKAELHQYLIEEDASTFEGPRGNKEATKKPMLTAAARVDGDDMPTRLRRVERRTGLLEWCIIGSAVFAVVWPFLFAWLDLSAFVRPASPGAESPQSVPVDSPSRSRTSVPKGRNSDFPPRSGTRSSVIEGGSDTPRPEVPKGSPPPAEPEETRPVTPHGQPQPTNDNGPKRIDDGTPSREANEPPPGSEGDVQEGADNSNPRTHANENS